jgi:nitroreductase
MDILEAMLMRRSVRTYQTQTPPQDVLDRVTRAYDEADRLNNVALRLLMAPAAQVEHGMTGLVGSYGKMKNPPLYAIGVSREGPNDQLNFGFVMEQFILACTREGLGTCWVGGFFKKSLLEQATPLEAGERIVCITPLGYAEQRRFGEKTMRALGGLNSRKPLSERVFEGAWGNPATQFLATRPTWLQVFEAARWAPSSSNSQPVHYVLHERRIVAATRSTVQAKYLTALGGKDHAEDLNFKNVDAGIAMAHVHLAAKHFGIAGRWSLTFDEPALHERCRVPAEARLVGVFETEQAI